MAEKNQSHRCEKRIQWYLLDASRQSTPKSIQTLRNIRNRRRIERKTPNWKRIPTHQKS